MMEHYNAFISYRHEPLDSAVAKEIHQQLERFRIPKAIAERTGVKRIQRIFRDKEELPITSDLNDDIAQALADADFLIVICSPRLKESLWCEKEIETFLKNHKRNQVLTVLAEGESKSVIPEILRYDTVIDEQTGEETKVLVEPLACDYRMSRRKARQEELPRLAAAIIGCSYDDLRQRQKLYRARRLTTVMATVAAFAIGMTAYYIWSNRRIQENYRMALENQSIYLASESQKALETGDRITAVQLAMAAMPGEDDDRPLTAEAELALSRAVGAYAFETASRLGVLKEDRYSNLGVEILDFWTNDTHDLLVTMDSQNMLKILDTKTHAVLWQIKISTSYYSITSHHDSNSFVMPLYEDRLLVWDGGVYTCYNIRSGDVLWTYQWEFYTDDASVLTPEGDRLLIMYSHTLVCVDTLRGSELWRCEYPNHLLEEEKQVWSSHMALLSENCFSPDGRQILFAAKAGFGPDAPWCGLSLDLDDQSWDWFPACYDEMVSAYWLDRETVAIMGYTENSPRADSEYTYKTSLNRESRAVLRCERLGDEDPLWEVELPYYVASLRETVRLCEDGNLFCGIANICWRVDSKTGEILGKNEMNSSVLDYVFQDAAAVHAVMADGSIGVYSFADQTVACSPAFVEGLKKIYRFTQVNEAGVSVPRYLALPENADCVESYFTGTNMDSRCHPLDWDLGFMSASGVLYGDTVVVHAAKVMYAVDVESGALKWSMKLTDFEDHEHSEYYTDIYPVGAAADQTKLIVQLEDSCTLFGVVDMETGAMDERQLEWDDGFVHSPVCLLGDKMYAFEQSTGDGETLHRMICYDPIADEAVSRPLELPEVYSSMGVYPCREKLFLVGDTTACLIDPGDLRVTCLKQAAGSADASNIWPDRQGLVYQVNNCDVILFDENGAAAQTITTDVPAVSVTSAPDRDSLLVLGTNGRIYVYSLSGERRAVIDLGLLHNIDPSTVIRWQFGGDGSLVVYFNYGAYLINMEVWKLELDLDWCFYAQADRFFCQRTDEDGETIAALYIRYTPEELLTMGQELADDLALQDPEKYGLK